MNKASKVLVAAEEVYAAAEEAVSQEARLLPGRFSPNRYKVLLEVATAARQALYAIRDAEQKLEAMK